MTTGTMDEDLEIPVRRLLECGALRTAALLIEAN
jgi:hypothetical protein